MAAASRTARAGAGSLAQERFWRRCQRRDVMGMSSVGVDDEDEDDDDEDEVDDADELRGR
jgi:hypothetical protein